MPRLLQLELKSGAIVMAQLIQPSSTQPGPKKACNGDSIKKQVSNKNLWQPSSRKDSSLELQRRNFQHNFHWQIETELNHCRPEPRYIGKFQHSGLILARTWPRLWSGKIRLLQAGSFLEHIQFIFFTFLHISVFIFRRFTFRHSSTCPVCSWAAASSAHKLEIYFERGVLT